MDGTAVIITNGKLATLDCKTAHGLIRGTERFRILGVIDYAYTGQDAGDVIDNKSVGIPVYESLQAMMENSSTKPDFAIVGVALSGGVLPPDFRDVLFDAIEKGVSVISGLHYHLSQDQAFVEKAKQHQVRLIDIRKPRPASELSFWSGDIYRVHTPRIAVLGLDCALGKRTTCRLLMESCRSNGLKTEMIYTGQTGWMQGYPYGLILDAIPNDFVSGEIEAAIVTCDREKSPDLILIEGQSALRNPSGPCGSEFILSGNTKGIVFQHAPFRKYFDQLEEVGCLLPTLGDEMALIDCYGGKVIAVTLNGAGGTAEELITYQKDLSHKLDVPVIRPLEEGVEKLYPVVRKYIKEHNTGQV